MKSKPAKVKIKVDGKRHKAPYTVEVVPGTVVKLTAPRTYSKKGVRWVFAKWKGVSGKRAKKKLKATVTVGKTSVTVKAVYKKVGRTTGS